MRDPQIVGVIDEKDIIRDAIPETRGVRLRLNGAQEVEIDLNAVDPLRGPEPQVGELLLYGTDAEGPWYQVLLGTDPCWEMVSTAVDTGQHLEFSVGVRLPKAPGFDPGSVRGRKFDNPGMSGFCVDAEGSVTHYIE